MTYKPRLAIAPVLIIALALPVAAQMAPGGQGAGGLQEKIASLKQSAAENQQRLHQYQWVETTQLTLKGEAKPPKQELCSYAPDGTVQKTPLGDSQPQQQQGRRLRQHIVEKKTEEMQEFMQQVKDLLGLYLPPNSQSIQQAYQGGNVSMNATAGSGLAQLVFRNYAQPGDQMTLYLDTRTKAIQEINISTYLNDPKDVVQLAVQFASLPDGINYAQQSVVDVPTKKMQVTITNSNYQRLAP
jgi:hypothetical protein